MYNKTTIFDILSTLLAVKPICSLGKDLALGCMRMKPDQVFRKTPEAHTPTEERRLDMHKLPFPVVKQMNLLLLTLPFVGCWLLYYSDHIIAAGSERVTVLIILSYMIVCFYFCQKLDCFRVSLYHVRDIMFRQVLATFITNVCIYVIIWMLSVHMPSLRPGILAWLAQCVVCLVWSLVMYKSYFHTHPPLKTIVIYDEREGMENLIHSYGLDKRFSIQEVRPVEEILLDLEQLSHYQAAFLCGVTPMERNRILKYAVEHSIKLYMVPKTADVMMRGSEQIHMLHLPILRVQRYRPSAEYRVAKRLCDVVLSASALVLLSPVLLLTALAVRTDGGPALYRQKRLTKDGKVFEILKFRSMIVDAEKYSGAVLSAGKDDPRITKVGKVIRTLHIDELPQLWNILMGDMSIVGPRPERPEIAAEIEKQLPEFAFRLQVKAGLTGYAQVYGKYNTTFYDKLLMDLMYISNPSVLEDLTIMLATLRILVDKDSTQGVSDDVAALTYREPSQRK